MLRTNKFLKNIHEILILEMLFCPLLLYVSDFQMIMHSNNSSKLLRYLLINDCLRSLLVFFLLLLIRSLSNILTASLLIIAFVRKMLYTRLIKLHLKLVANKLLVLIFRPIAMSVIQPLPEQRCMLGFQPRLLLCVSNKWKLQ